MIFITETAALACVATMSIRIPTPGTNGYIHPGDAIVILSGVILSIGRIVGETAALIFTAGTVPAVPKVNAGIKGFFGSSVRTLSVHMYNLSKEGLHTDQAFATAVVLLVFVIVINFISNILANKLKSKV